MHQLHSLFASNFLIDPAYAASFLPQLYQVLQSKEVSAVDRTAELTARAHHKIQLEGDAASTAKTVVIISIKQPILKFSDWYMGFLGSKTYMRIMDSYRGDPNVAGIVLDIDSGGGQVYGTGEFYDYIREYPKPIVAYTDGLMASAAYYIGNACKYIVANKRADAIGSLGAYAAWVDFTGLWEKLGASIVEMYATKSTEKNYESREADKGNFEPYIKNVLDPIVETFHADMKATRPGLNEAVFAGGTWGGTEALEMGLVDELGTLDTAVMKVFELDNQQSNNQNSNTMSKQRANVQAVLGLSAPLASTPEKGIYLNDEQVDSIESHLEAQTAAATLLQADYDKATADLTAANSATKAAQDDLTAANTAETAAVDKLLTDAGLPVAGTTAEKYTALTTHYAAFNKGDGATHTHVPKAGDDAGSTGATVVSGVDLSILNNS